MKEIIKEILDCREKLYKLEQKLNNPEYWINKAVKDTDFVPTKDTWVHIDVKSYEIRISIYVDHSGKGKGVHWINGRWFNTALPFSKDIPYIMDKNKILESFY